MLAIREQISDEVEINNATVCSLYFNLLVGGYDTIMMYHGDQFTTALMELYADCELYETCARMRDEIKYVNELTK